MDVFQQCSALITKAVGTVVIPVLLKALTHEAGVQGGSQPPCLADVVMLHPIGFQFAGGGPGGQSAPLPDVQQMQQQQHSSNGQVQVLLQPNAYRCC
jgi:hypothetical protein